ncbi:MAG: two-component system, cell cycle response regulator DivK [Pyrinomonadaceae bacterium]|jgi:CheY-like chemotaxis protein|nr:two-component system, cell cycle response regulator DivK [Pyrinomonadaceae bacterium]
MPLARILIADDYDDNRELLRLMLETAGYGVRETRDGLECVAAARAELPDLALIDLSMPVLDGWGTLAALRADERTSRLHCIAVTAFAADQDRQRALDAGFDAYLAKPYRSKDLLELVERILRESRSGSGRDSRLKGDGRQTRDGHRTPHA